MAQTYGLKLHEFDLAGEPPDETIRWLASLCVQLPADARVRVMDDPNLAWDDATRIQRVMDYRLQSIAYLLTGKGPKPKPLDTPDEATKKQRAFESAEQNRSMVDELLGFSHLGGDA